MIYIILKDKKGIYYEKEIVEYPLGQQLMEKYKDVAEDYVNSVGANPFDQVVVSSEYIVSEAEIISETCSKKEQEEDELE